MGTAAYADEGIVQQTVRRLKAETDLVVITDVCLCQYTAMDTAELWKGIN